MDALVMMDSSKFEVPPKLFTTRATSMPKDNDVSSR